MFFFDFHKFFEFRFAFFCVFFPESEADFPHYSFKMPNLKIEQLGTEHLKISQFLLFNFPEILGHKDLIFLKNTNPDIPENRGKESLTKHHKNPSPFHQRAIRSNRIRCFFLLLIF